MKWEKVAIKDICTGIYDGPHATPPLSDTGAIFLGISNFNNGRLDFSDIRYISEDDLPKWTKRVIPQKNDIVFSYEATLNLYAIIPEGFRGCLGRRMALLRVNETKADYKFLYYYFYSDAWRATVNENIVLGATVDRIPLIKFPDFQVELPPLETQHRIADILSAYDNLIENNQKQIKLLEEAAQRLYKEWFVDLRFPGHENTKIVDGVPEGWTRNPIQDFISYEIGGGWGEELQNEKSMIPAYVIRGTDIKGLVNGQLQSVPYRYHTAGSLETRKLLDGDIVFEVSGGSKTEGVARTVRIIDLMLKTWENSVICASFCKRIKPIPNFSQYLYDSFRWMRLNGKTQEYDKKSASSIVNYRWKDFLAQEKILKPDEETISQYNNIAGTIYTKIIVCSCQIEQAKMKRDILLPKLMSGELEV